MHTTFLLPMSVTELVSKVIGWSNSAAPLNMLGIAVTRLVSHPDRSWSNSVRLLISAPKSVTTTEGARRATKAATSTLGSPRMRKSGMPSEASLPHAAIVGDSVLNRVMSFYRGTGVIMVAQ